MTRGDSEGTLWVVAAMSLAAVTAASLGVMRHAAFEAGREPSFDVPAGAAATMPGPSPRPTAGAPPRPRLKPDPSRTSVKKARPLSRVLLAPSAPVGITAGEDVTGGRAPLFADYRRQLAVTRDEAGYRTLAAQPGEDLGALIARAGYERDAEAALEAIRRQMPDDWQPMTDAVDLADLETGDANRLERVRFFPHPGTEVVAWRAADGWTARRDRKPVTTSHVTAASVMTDSLFGAGGRAGIPREIMARMANLFLYDVDFVRDIRRGDRFEIVYEVSHDEDGTPLGTGDIVFAAMTWRGGREARGYYRFDGAAGIDAAYFDEDGASARRLLMKTPIEGARVTSRFGPRRHPTLGYTKAHKGVDFGARAGTPIMAAGDGTVVRAAPLGSYGNFLLIRHANGYETAYAHLRAFAKGVRKGARVRQGEVVAYVGSTGRSTGPHLHYEVRAEGKHVNPMTLEVATGAVLTDDELVAFRAARTRADAMRALPFAVAAR